MKKERGNYKSEQDKKNKNILLRLTSSEKLDIERKAQEVDLTVSEYIRQIVMKGYILTTTKEEKKKDPTESNSLDRRTIIGLATNLNQLTKHVNSTHEIHPDLQACLKAITAIINKG